MSKSGLKNPKASKTSNKPVKGAPVKQQYNPYVVFCLVLGDGGVEVTQEVDLANKPISDKLHFFGTDAVTWLEDHYGVPMEESVAIIEGMRQANLIVNVKNPDTAFVLTGKPKGSATSSSQKSSTARVSKLKSSRTAGSKPSSADNSDDDLGFGGDSDDDIFNSGPTGSGSGAEQWTTTGPKVFFNNLKVEHVIALLDEIKESDTENKSPSTEKASKMLGDKDKAKNKDGTKKPPVAPKNSTVSNIIQLMTDYGVTSIPVESHHQVSMVGLMDILVHAVETFDKVGTSAKTAEFKSSFDISTDQLIGSGNRTPYKPIFIDSSVKEMLQTMSMSRLHDVAVTDRNGAIVTLINQMDVMRFISQLAHHFAASSTTIDDYRFAYKKIISIDSKSPAIDAFRRLDALNMRRLAIVGPSGALIETLSASDILPISPTGDFFDQYLAPLDEFMPWLRSWGTSEVQSVPPSTKMLEICRKFVADDIHSIFVSEKAKARKGPGFMPKFSPQSHAEPAIDHYLGVITVSDVIQLIASVFGESASAENEPSRVKLVLIGDPGPSKSEVVQMLLGEDKQATKDDNLFQVQVDTIVFHTWNFPLQRSDHTAHQFFLTGKGVYLLCYKSEQPVESLIEWCRALHLHTPRAPLLIVVTMAHKMKEKNFDAYKQPILKKLSTYRVFDMLQCTTKASSKKTKELRDSLVKLVEKFKVINNKVKQPLMPLMQAISYRKQQMIIPVTEFKQLTRVSSDKMDELQQALGLLNDAGVILRFENDMTLKDLIIVDITVFYKLLTIINQLRPMALGNAVVSNSDLLSIFQGVFAPSLYKTVVDLLEAFEIIYRYRSGDSMETWIVPSIVEERAPKKVGNWDPALTGNNLYYRVWQFKFAPFALFSRVMVLAMSTYPPECIAPWNIPPDTPESSDAPKVRRQGLLLELRKSTTLIEFDDQANELHLRVKPEENGKDNSEEPSPLELFCNLCSNIDALFDVFYAMDKASIERKVFCSLCSKTAKEPHFFSWKDFALKHYRGEQGVMCEAAGKFVKIERVAPDLVFAQLPQLTGVSTLSNLGKGAFGLVNLGEKSDGEKVAIKELIMPPDVSDEIILEKFHEFHHEVFIASCMKHTHLVNLHGLMNNPPRIVMDLAGQGVLGEIIYNEQIPDDLMPMQLRLKICLDIARGMKAMHEIKPPIVHRDLRSFNIFMSSYNPDDVVTAKVGDFGLSTAVPISLSDILATWQWLAPEVTEPNSRYDERSDIYSFGVVVYEVMARILPFTEFDEFLQKTEQPLTDDQLNDSNLLKQLEGAGFEIRGTKAVREEFLVHKIRTAILNGLRPSMPASTPPFVSQLVRLCWSATPEERPAFSEIVHLFSTRLGLEEPQTLRKKTVGIKLVDTTKKAARPMKTDQFKDNGDYAMKKGNGAAIHDKIVAIRKELKEKKKAREAAQAAKEAAAAGDGKAPKS